MTEEELLKKRAAAYKKMMEANLKRKKMTGMVAGDKEIEMLKKSIPTAELDEKFIAERTGGAVTEEELKMLKKLMPR